MGPNSCAESVELKRVTETGPALALASLSRVSSVVVAVAVAVLIASACGNPGSTTVLQGDHTPSELPVLNVPEDWQLVEVLGWPSFRGFSLYLPPGWAFPEPGLSDVYSRRFEGDGTRLSLLYGGAPRGDVVASDDYADQVALHFISYEDIGGHSARLVRPRGGAGRFTSVYIEDRPNISIAATDLSQAQQETAFAIFRSIRDLGGVLEIHVTLEGSFAERPPGSPPPPPGVNDPGPSVVVQQSATGDWVSAKRVTGSGPIRIFLRRGTYLITFRHPGDVLIEGLPQEVTMEPQGSISIDVVVRPNR